MALVAPMRSHGLIKQALVYKLRSLFLDFFQRAYVSPDVELLRQLWPNGSAFQPPAAILKSVRRGYTEADLLDQLTALIPGSPEQLQLNCSTAANCDKHSLGQRLNSGPQTEAEGDLLRVSLSPPLSSLPDWLMN